MTATSPADTTVMASPAPPPPTTHRVLGWLAVLGGLVAAVGILTLDAVLGDRQLRGKDLRQQTISEYVYTPGSWAFNGAVIALALGSVALLVGLIRSGVVRPIGAGSGFLAVWIVGLAGIVAFPKHNWALGPSTGGSIHRVASLVTFLALPIAVLLIARRTRRRESNAASAAFWFALGAAACLTILFGAVIIGLASDRGWWQLIPLGLLERGIAGFEVAAVIALGIWVLRGRRRPEWVSSRRLGRRQ